MEEGIRTSLNDRLCWALTLTIMTLELSGGGEREVVGGEIKYIQIYKRRHRNKQVLYFTSATSTTGNYLRKFFGKFPQFPGANNLISSIVPFGYMMTPVLWIHCLLWCEGV